MHAFTRTTAATSSRATYALLPALLLALLTLLVFGGGVARAALPPADPAPTIGSDLLDYPPGGHVVLSGTHWNRGENVHLFINDESSSTWKLDADTTADELGNVHYEFDLPRWFVADYSVKATGDSGRVATATFTDSNVSLRRATTADNVLPAGTAFTVSYDFYNNSEVCSGTPDRRSSVVAANDTGAIAGIGNGDSVKIVGATPASGTAVFNYWSIANDTTQLTNLCLAGNGTINTLHAHFRASQAAQTITFPAMGAKTYGDADVDPGATASSNLAVSYTTTTPAVCSIVAGKVRLLTAGSCTVTASQAGNANYLPAQDASRTFTVAKAPLTVKADDKSREYGAANPAFTGTLTGLKNGDAITASYSTAADAKSAASDTGYAIVPALADPGSKLSNYAVTSTNGKLVVTKAPLSVKADDKSREYGAANPAFTGSLTGVKNSDAITASYSTAADAKSAVSDTGYAIVPALADTDGKLSNYAVTSTNGKLVVTKADLTATAKDATRTYGAANPDFTGTLTGVRNDDDVTATYATQATAGTGVGTHAIVPTVRGTDAVLGNYRIAVNNAQLKVTPADLTVSADDQTKVYGQQNPTLTGKVVGLKNGDEVDATYTTAADVKTGVGTAAIVAHVANPGAADVLGNYAVTLTDAKLTITKAALTVTAADKSKTYGDANPALTGTVKGLVDGDDVNDSYTTAAEEKSGIGSYAIAAHVANVDDKDVLANYEVKLVDAQLTVGKAPLTVTADDKTKTYGEANPELTGTVEGLVNGDKVSDSYTTAATAGSKVGSYAIAAHVADAADSKALANYAVELVDAKLTVAKAPLKITAADKTKTYGQANPALTGEIVGLQNGDEITANYTTAASTASKVGDYAILPAAVDSEDEKLANYDVTVVDGTLTVIKAALKITADDKSKTYGEANPALTGKLEGVQNGDEITASYATAATTASKAGDYAIVPTAIDSDEKLANYDVSVVNGKLTVTQAALKIIADNGTKVYGEANPSLTGKAVGLVNGDEVDDTYTTTATAKTGVGSYTIAAHVADVADSKALANYDVTLVDAKLTVTKAPLAAKADDKSRAYGQANPTLTGELTGVQNADEVTVSYSTTATATSGVGEYAVTPAVHGEADVLANYQDAKLTNGTLTITKAALKITADDKTKVYGQANPALTGKVEGVQNEDGITAGYSTPATAASNVGDHPIVPKAVDSDEKLANYDVTLVNGTLEIAKATLTITADDKTKVYGQANPALTGKLEGVQNDDEITASYSTPATAASKVGDHAIIPAAVDSRDEKLANYDVTLVNGKLTVTKAPLTVTADDQTKVYGQANPTLTGIVKGLVNGDEINDTYTTTATAKTGVGSYTIAAHVADVADSKALANYDVELVDAELTVIKAALKITADDKSKTYGHANPALTGKLEGVQNGDEITASYATAATTASKVGDYAIVPKAVDSDEKLANYDVSVVNGTLTVTKAALKITADDKAKVYGDANPGLTGTVEGLVNGDKVNDSYTTAATAGSKVGSYAIVADVKDVTGSEALANYTVEFVNAKLTVTKAPLAAKADDKSRTYGQANPTLTGELTGVQNADEVTVSYSTTATATSGVGEYAVTPAVHGEADVLANYQDAKLTNGTLTIDRAALKITADDKTKTYGDANPALTGDIVGLQNGDDITADYTTAATEASDVGDHAIVPTAVDSEDKKLANYDVALVNGTLTINQAALKITADDKTKTYGDANPALTGKIEGRKNGDEITADYGTAATAASNVGDHAIVPAAVDSDDKKLANYDITLVNGKLTVTKARLTITAQDNTKVYGDTNPDLAGKIEGRMNGDAITAGYSTTATMASTVGDYAIVPKAVDSDDKKLANYDVTLVNGTLTVTKAALKIIAADKTKTYGQANPTLTGKLEGVQNDDEITADYRTSAITASTVGDYAIVPKAVDSDDKKLANYDVTLVNGTLTVTKATLTVTAADKTKVYGDANPALTGKVDGLVGDDEVNDTYTTTADMQSGAGTVAITAHVKDVIDGDALDNYDVELVHGTLTIARAPLAAKADDKTKVYGDDNPTLTGTLTGVRNGDDVTATYRTAATTGSDVGEYAITPKVMATDAALANYKQPVLTDGTLTVTKAALTIEVSTESMTYGGTVPAFEVIGMTGLKAGDTASVVDGTLSCPAANYTAGTRDVTCGGLSAGNYRITYEGGKLTVDKAELKVDASDATMTYRGTLPTLKSSLSGFQGSDTAAVTSGAAKCTAIDASALDTGTYTGAITCEPGDLAADNYTFATGEKGTLTITKAAQSISFPAIDPKKLGDADFAPGATASSGLTVTYTASPASVCTIVSGKVHIAGVGTCTVTAAQAGNGNYLSATSVDRQVGATYKWTGFFQPINQYDSTGRAYVLNVARAGSAIPVKFSLGGNQGLNVFWTHSSTTYPNSGPLACDSSAVQDAVEEYATTTTSGLKYDATADQYNYTWKTSTSFAGTCRQLIVRLADGTYQRANFKFTK